MSLKTLSWLGFSGIAVVVAVCFAVLFGVQDSDSPSDVASQLDDTAKDRLATDAAIKQIAAESKIIDTPDADTRSNPAELATNAVAPPNFVPAPPVDHEATPPPGFSFASYHEVKRAPMTVEDFDHEGTATPTPEWMTYGPGMLADQAAATERDWTFGWVKLAEGADLAALRGSLAAHGGQLLGEAGDLVRARLPHDAARLRAIAAAESVAGIGAVPAERKVTDTLRELAFTKTHDQVPVWITLMGDDPDGRWRSALKDLGAEVGQFDPAIRTYAATIPLDTLGPIAEADYVLAVETIGRVEPTLEIAAPSMGADALRTYDQATGMFTGVGGASVTVGVMDSGLNVDHPDISSNRRSICGANFTDAVDPREEDQDMWFDYIGHGTHVTGIVLGNGAVDPSRAGMAPLVQDIRFAKALSSYGGASALAWNRAMDWFAKPTACGDGVPRKALVINSSLGVGADLWEGRSVVERKIDASIWAARQLFVTSAGNSGTDALASMAGAKNALSVGAAQNIGDIASFSSQGPTVDGRLMPKIVGTGVSVAAPDGFGSRDGYVALSGTSMSSPSVVGVAALVMDAMPELREEPAALRARLMASAIKPDAFMGDDDAFPLDNTNGPGSIQNVFGLGKVSARTAVLNRDEEHGWVGGSAAFDMDADSHAYHDIVVPEGASRLDIVMSWDEPAADSIASPVLHDLDLWVDRGASCQTIGACGHYNSRSRVDNVEWVIVPNPPAGVYRLKVLPNRIYGTAPRAGLAWTVIRGESTPTLSVAADNDSIEVAPEKSFDVTVTMSNDAYVAAGANLRVDCRAEVGSEACDGLSYEPMDSGVEREDGVERSLVRDGVSIVVGEIGPDEQQTVSLRFSGQPEGSFRLHFSASAWNGNSASTSVGVVVGEPESGPPAPTQQPSNDDFANAMVLEDAEGEVTFDLVTATPDPGEPAYALAAGHPQRARSVWYVWTASETALARFSVAQAVEDDYADFVVVDVFPDGPLSSLKAVGTGLLGGGSTFFADEGETYRVRLSINSVNIFSGAKPTLMLKWGAGSRPENDDYVLAALIEGETGSLEGSNQGATTELDELMGNSSAFTPVTLDGWGASVWHNWTAPSTGDWRFSVDRRSLIVAVFVGDTMADARLVSGVPAGETVFPATEGVEYRIAVASGSSYFGAADFTLSWEPGLRESPGNDDFAAAEFAFGNFAFGSISPNDLTVEHGEPVESGVRTAWWNWQAAADARYTWLVSSDGLGDAPLQMSVFEGDDLTALQLVGVDTGDESVQLQTVFDARAGASYRVALGLPRDAAQVSLGVQFIAMEWGETPENDDYDNAAPLVAASGTVAGSNEFATSEKGERTGTLGDSSLWWTFEPEASGWMRFAVDGPNGSKLAIYMVDANGDMELVSISRDLVDVAATFRVEAGARYVVRYGTYYWDASGYGGAGRGSFELSWGPSEAPALLRYVGSVESGQIADDGTEIELSTLGNQAFNADGTELYVASAGGIVVFDRDPDTGKLVMQETLAEYPVFDPDTQLIWDDNGDALLVASCDAWLKFTPREGGGIEPAGQVDGAPCASEGVLLHGDLVHNIVKPWLIETYRFDEGHDALSLVDSFFVPDVAMAVLTPDGSHMYAVTEDDDEYALYVIERDGDTGTLRIAAIMPGGMDPGVDGLADVQALAVNSSHLFVSVGSGGAATLVFDLADPANPAPLGLQDAFVSVGASFANCYYPVARSNVAAVDVACGSFGHLYTVQVASDGAVMASDFTRANGFNTDAFGNVIPANDDVLSFAGSPDGRHLYLAGSVFTFFFDPDIGFGFLYTDQMLVFERVYEAEVDSAETDG